MHIGYLVLLAILLIAPGGINYGLLVGQKNFARYLGVALFVALPLFTLVYVYLHQQSIDTLASKDLIGWSDYDQEDVGGFILTMLAAPVLVSGIVSTLLAAIVVLLKKRKPES